MGFTSILVRENQPSGRIGGGDHDITAYRLINMRNHLNEKSLDQLKVEALKMEKYIHSKSEFPIMGGLHDYIGSIKKEELVEIMTRMMLNNQELLEIEVYNSVVAPEKKLTFLGDDNSTTETEEEREPKMVGGLVDYIWRQTDETLRQWALTCDKFDKEKRNIHVLGGLHDYIDVLSREQLMEIILKHSRTYSELNSGVSLNKLAMTYGFAQPEEKKEETEPLMVGGLVDYIWRESEDVLRQWALTCERYEKERKNIHLLGGLVNYVRLLNKEQLMNIILDYARKYPELNSRVELNNLAQSYGIAPSEEEVLLKMGGGLHDYIWRLPEETLRQWALTCDKYDRKTRNVNFRGGLVNYVRLLKKEELIQIIMDFAKQYPELNSATKLQELATSYGLTTPEN